MATGSSQFYISFAGDRGNFFGQPAAADAVRAVAADYQLSGR
jgi:hypothetical protein